MSICKVSCLKDKFGLSEHQVRLDFDGQLWFDPGSSAMNYLHLRLTNLGSVVDFDSMNATNLKLSPLSNISKLIVLKILKSVSRIPNWWHTQS